MLDGNEPSLADDPDFSAAFSRVPAAHLGAVYVDLQSLGSLIELGMAEGMSVGAMPVDIESLLAQLPEDMVAYLAAAPDRLTLEAFITASDAMAALPVGESDLAALFPGDTQLYVETRELGAIVAGAARRAPGLDGRGDGRRDGSPRGHARRPAPADPRLRLRRRHRRRALSRTACGWASPPRSPTRLPQPSASSGS